MSRHDDGRDVTDMNPFSATAVARVSESATDFFTIGTGTVQEALSVLSSSLGDDEQPRRETLGASVTVALVGDHGTGKTHLCIELLRHARRLLPGRIQACYLDAPAATFLALHRQFTEALPRAEIATAIRTLPDTTDDLLAGTVRDDDLALCLRLLRDPEHEAAAWEWLCGYPLTESLAAQGIRRSVSSEQLGIDVMAGLATVLHLAGRRVVLIVDEIEKILSASSRTNAAAVAAFRAFLSAFSSTGAVLVIAGVPDWLQVLDEDVRRRIGRIVTMSSMSVADTIEFIRKSMDRAYGSPELAPFSEHTAEYITQLADGVPRRIVRICYQLQRRALDEQTSVTYAMVRDVIRTYFDLVSPQEVRSDIGRILTIEGRPFVRDHLLGEVPDLPVDFWLPIGDGRSGCCLLLTEGVLKSEDVERLLRRADSVRTAAGRVEIQLVVVGYLPAEFERQLADGFGADPIVYGPQRFADDLSAALRTMTRRLEESVGIDPLTSVSSQLERVSRQQTHSQRSVEQLTAHLDEIRLTFESQFSALQRSLAEVAEERRPRTQQDEPDAPETGGALPHRVESLFAGALAALDGVGQVDSMFRDAFRGAGDSGRPRADATRLTVRSVVHSADVLPALGMTVLLREMVGTFRSAVAAWLSHHSISAASDDTAALDALCRTYESEFEEVPLFRLDGLGELAARRSGHVDAVGQLVWSRQRVEIRETLATLAERVRIESLRAISTSEGL